MWVRARRHAVNLIPRGLEVDARWAVGLLAVGMLAAGVLLGAAAPASTGELSQAPAGAARHGGVTPVAVPLATGPTVVVRPGDTLWSIAARTFPEADPREAIVAFRQANGSQLAELRPGQRIVVPTRA